MGRTSKLLAVAGFVVAMGLVSLLVLSWRKDAGAGDRRVDQRRFFWLAGASTVAVTIALWAGSIARNDGIFTYVLDDAGIHMSIVRQLLHHGTWGVSSGEYASASSSPGWTVVLGAATGVLPFAAQILPLILNLLAGLWIVWLFARHQDFLVVRRDEPMGLVLIVLLPVVLWFLPGLAIVGMEHALHAALVLVVLVLLQRLEATGLGLRAALPYLLTLLVATAVRFESAFLAVGCAIALVAVGLFDRLRTEETSPNWAFFPAVRLAALSGVAAGVPVLVFGLVNKAFGEDFFPNSVVAKSALKGERGLDLLPGPIKTLEALAKDQMVLVTVVLLTAYVVWAWFGGPRRNLLSAIALLVTAVLHAGFADFHSYSRYQAYLVIAGSFVLFRIASEVIRPEWRRPALTFGVVAIVILSTVRVTLTFNGPLSSSNTYRQRYQLALFFRDYYKDRTIATGELGYSTFLHDGPVVDLLGLGTHEVLQRLRTDGYLPPDYVQDLTRRRGVAVVGMYGATRAQVGVPDDWVLAGEWILEEPQVTAFDFRLQFYAPTREFLPELVYNLHQFEPRLPSRVRVVYPPT